MASAILTAMFPTVYTVCDILASAALGQKDYGSLRYYVAYLSACRRMAAQHGVALRDFDRANWQWSKDQSKVRGAKENRRRRITSLSLGSGPVGASVTIAGTNFGLTQGAGTVKFNGTTATVSSWSAGPIVTTVPSGTTTGNVVVTVGGMATTKGRLRW
jgi:hypothetical protein